MSDTLCNSDATAAKIPDPENFRLCFVSDGKAYFTDAEDFGALVHDDWDDGYDTAGLYGVEDPYELVDVIYDGPIEEKNYEKAPQDIIAGEMEWLASNTFADEPVSIPAKCELSTFVELVQKAGGQVYLPANEVK